MSANKLGERYYSSAPGQTGLSEIHAVFTEETELGQSGSARTVCIVPNLWAENVLAALRSGFFSEETLKAKGWRRALREAKKEAN